MDFKKKILIIVAAITLTVIAAIVIGIIFVKNKNGNVIIAPGDFSLRELDNSVKAPGNAIAQQNIPQENSQEAKQLALMLYNIADANLKTDQKLAYYVHTQSQVLGVPTAGHRFYVKNGNEYFGSDYFYIGEAENVSSTVKNIIKTASKESTQYSTRAYFRVDLDKGFEQKSKHVFVEETDEKFNVGADWNDLYYDKEITIPDIMSQSTAAYSYSDFVINENTVSYASVTYNEEQGLYVVQIKLDCSIDETMGDSLQYLIAGTNDKNSRYTDITITAEIWECGRFKTVFSYNKWLAKKAYGFMRMESANDYKTYFYYSDYALNIDNYPFAKETKELFNSRYSK